MFKVPLLDMICVTSSSTTQNNDGDRWLLYHFWPLNKSLKMHMYILIKILYEYGYTFYIQNIILFDNN